VLHRSDGTELVFECNHTMSEEHIEWFRAGSALNIIRARTGS
jgi:aconitate hydratase